MDDDLNTADALGVIFEYVRDMNASLNEHSSRAAVEKGVNALNEMAGVLGLLRREADLVPEDVKALVEERQAAKRPGISRRRTRSAPRSSRWAMSWRTRPRGRKCARRRLTGELRGKIS